MQQGAPDGANAERVSSYAIATGRKQLNAFEPG